jgi:hypothetical protein
MDAEQDQCDPTIRLEQWRTEPISGRVHVRGRDHAFRGWVELVALIEQLRTTASQNGYRSQIRCDDPGAW